ncbi:hypothetical protein HAX54_027115 [Datura stramonium]|uniref:Uncharacterized protein n=1 Tax=Datura stramonium TaxID=4076 RepID=A0ABS8V4U4_DATST|nr:hypothetical protein [Datura stramonium]
MLVRGKEVDITPKAINSIYWVDPVHSVTGFARRQAARDHQYAWVEGIIAKVQPLWTVMKGDIHRQYLEFEVRMWLELAEGVLDLDTKRDKDTPSFKKTGLTLGMSDSHIAEVLQDCPISRVPTRPASSSMSGILKFARITRDNNAQLVKQDKDIHPMIQNSIKMAMKIVVEMLGSLCARWMCLKVM